MSDKTASGSYMNHEPKRSKSTMVIVVVIILVILAVALANTKNDSNSDFLDQPATDTSDESASDDGESLLGVMYDYINPFEWQHQERAIEAVSSLADNQILNYGIVADPNNPSVRYFSTSVIDEEQEEILLSVYRYNSSDYTWVRLYRQTYTKESGTLIDAVTYPILHVIGYEDGDLILLAQDIEDYPKLCADPYLTPDSPSTALITMSTEDPYGGFVDYTLSDEAERLALARQEKCSPLDF
jgi:hypothetical protein